MDNKKALMPNRRYDITLYNPPDCGGSAGDEYGYIYSCPNCKRDFDEAHTSNFCDKCGQEIGWNRRPDLWIPVTERLPESGKHVLLCCEVRPAMKRYICDGYYAKAKSIINSCSFDYECAVEYDEEQDEYFLLEGFYEVIKNWDEYSSISIGDFVTHWMPLPEPPKEVK